MKMQIIEVNSENIENFSLCGYKDTKKEQFQRKAEWLRKRFAEGLRYKVLYSENDGVIGSIEYIPGEFAWRPVEADKYMFIHCISIEKRKYREQGFGWMLVEDCISEARKKDMNGVAVVARKGSWMVGNQLFLKHGFEIIDKKKPDFELLALRFNNGLLPGFKPDMEKNIEKYGKGLVILYSDQCPYISKFLNDSEIAGTAKSFGIEPEIIEIKSYKDAQKSPAVFGIFIILYNGKVVAYNPISNTRFKNILDKEVKKSEIKPFKL